MQQKHDILADALAVIRNCQQCSKANCSDECRAFTRAQLEEIAEKAASGNYKRIYS